MLFTRLRATISWLLNVHFYFQSELKYQQTDTVHIGLLGGLSGWCEQDVVTQILYKCKTLQQQSEIDWTLEQEA